MHHFNYERTAMIRQKFLDPGKFVTFVAPERSDVVADIGAGDGYYSVLLSPYVREVHAFDAQHDSLSLIPDKQNIRKHRLDVCSGLPHIGFTKVIFVNSFHDLLCRDSILRQLSHEIKAQIIVFMEFKKQEMNIGPPVSIRISEGELDKILDNHGYLPVGGTEMEIFYLRKFRLA